MAPHAGRDGLRVLPARLSDEPGATRKAGTPGGPSGEAERSVDDFLDQIETLTGARPTTIVAGRLSLLATDPDTRAAWERSGITVFVDQTRDRFLSTMSPSEIDGEG